MPAADQRSAVIGVRRSPSPPSDEALRGSTAAAATCAPRLPFRHPPATAGGAAVAGVVYLDTSALVKLVAAEPETDALTAWLRERPVRVTSIVGRIELLRAVRRVTSASRDDALSARASAVVDSLAVTVLSDAIAERAANLDPGVLRTLDAIHLATAILAGPIDGFVAYNERLVDAARSAGLTVVQPGREPRQ
jgi:predicted nucleic acid-binding protein